MEAPHVSWILDTLTDSTQRVHWQHCVSHRVVSNTGGTQGTILSPFLFNPYTKHFSYCIETFQKFSEYSARVGCISKGDEDANMAIVDNSAMLSCRWFCLHHVTKTKELAVDLRRPKVLVTPVFILGVSVDTVEDYK